VLCTGYSAEAQREAHLAEGFTRVLQKPFTLQELQGTLAAARSAG
jgi:CheY-like chemotaxis protein